MRTRSSTTRPLADDGGRAEVKPRDEARIVKLPWDVRLYAWLMQPVHPSTLGVFRVVYGTIMYEQAGNFGWMFREFSTSKMLFPYPMFDWIPPAFPLCGEILLLLMQFFAALTAAGAATRLATTALFVSYTYLFLQCQSFHNNHYILICHVTLVASHVDWGAWASVDAVVANYRAMRRTAELPVAGEKKDRRSAPTIPYWHLLVIQFLFCIPYSFGALAKFNEDCAAWRGSKHSARSSMRGRVFACDARLSAAHAAHAC